MDYRSHRQTSLYNTAAKKVLQLRKIHDEKLQTKSIVTSCCKRKFINWSFFFSFNFPLSGSGSASETVFDARRKSLWTSQIRPAHKKIDQCLENFLRSSSSLILLNIFFLSSHPQRRLQSQKKTKKAKIPRNASRLPGWSDLERFQLSRAQSASLAASLLRLHLLWSRFNWNVSCRIEIYTIAASRVSSS